MIKFVNINTIHDEIVTINLEDIKHAKRKGEEFSVRSSIMLWKITKESYIRLYPYLFACDEEELKDLINQVNAHFRRVRDSECKIKEYEKKLSILNNEAIVTTALLKKHLMFSDFLEINDIQPEVRRMLITQTTIKDENQTWSHKSDKIQNMTQHYDAHIGCNKRLIESSEELIFNMK